MKNVRILVLALFLVVLTIASGASAAPAKAPDKDELLIDIPAEADEQRFSERKAEVLRRIGDRISEMQARVDEMEKKLNCAQAANTPDNMKACFPNMANGGADVEGGWEERRREWREYHEGWKRQHGRPMGTKKAAEPTAPADGEAVKP